MGSLADRIGTSQDRTTSSYSILIRAGRAYLVHGPSGHKQRIPMSHAEAMIAGTTYGPMEVHYA